jgi:carboxymethylenebutenolidase
LVGQSTALTPVHPVDVAGKLQAPVLGLYGGADTGIPLDSVEAMKTALAAGPAAAKASKFLVYPDTPHAFHADYRSSYDQGAAADAWQQTLAWFKEWLRA